MRSYISDNAFSERGPQADIEDSLTWATAGSTSGRERDIRNLYAWRAEPFRKVALVSLENLLGLNPQSITLYANKYCLLNNP